jgi:hypothetical protein
MALNTNRRSGQALTNNYATDGGESGGLGVLTARAQSGDSSAAWSASDVDGFGRVDADQNSRLTRSAYGIVPGAGSVSAALDGRPLSVQFEASGSGDWHANMDLAPGPHTLQVTAAAPSGLYFASVTNTFACATNSGDSVQDPYYVDGNVAQRVWLNALGETIRSQTFTWDAFNRLIGLSERDARNNGYDWWAVFDGLGRRVQATGVIVTNCVALTNQPTTIVSYFDPT